MPSVEDKRILTFESPLHKPMLQVEPSAKWYFGIGFTGMTWNAVDYSIGFLRRRKCRKIVCLFKGSLEIFLRELSSLGVLKSCSH